MPNWIKCTDVFRGDIFLDLGWASLERLIENEASVNMRFITFTDKLEARPLELH